MIDCFISTMHLGTDNANFLSGSSRHLKFFVISIVMLSHAVIYFALTDTISDEGVFKQPLKEREITFYVGIGNTVIPRFTDFNSSSLHLKIKGEESTLKKGSGELGNPSSKDQSLSQSNQSDIQKTLKYVPATNLDIAPVPISDLDPNFLNGTETVAIPIRLRIFIDASGNVTEVKFKDALVLNSHTCDLIKEMLLKTKFIPGRLRGQDIASFIDIELSINEINLSAPETIVSPFSK